MKNISVPKLKNKDSPMGRKDWEGRSPRWRLSLTYPQLRILLECMENFYNDHPEALEDETHNSLHVRLAEVTRQMDTPLVDKTQDFPLLDLKFDFDE